MNFVHQTLEKSGHTLDVLTDPERGLQIMVSRHGAELVSLAKRKEGNWTGFLYRDGDVSPAPSGWNNHATLMGYFLHRLKEEHTFYRGRELRGSTHSFLRHKTFGVPEFDSAEGTLTYRIDPGQILPEEYPGSVAFALTYALVDGALKVGFRFANLDEKDCAHVSFGLHPGFAVDGMESAEVILPSGHYVRYLAPGNFLSGETVAFEHLAGPMPFAKSELPGSFLLELVNVPAPVFELHTGNRRVALGFDEVPYVTLWSDGHPFICIEPCWGLPDHAQQRPFEDKLGIQVIPAGGTLSREFSIKPFFAD